MRRINLNLLIFILFAFGVLLIKARSTRVERLPTSATEEKVPAQVLSIVNTPSIAKAVMAMPQTPKIEGKVVQPYAKELAKYSELKKKVFLNGQEAAAKEQILKNEKVLRGMGARLNHSPTDSKEAIEQNAAIDMLLEALRSGDNEVATEVLRSVVTDGSIEDESLELSQRENLAGVKAEVLFQWSALKPAQASELAGLLPGPVSQKIWQNVVSAQKSGLAESARLEP